MLDDNKQMKERILVIEDEAAIREMLGYALMKEGYIFEEAADVEDEMVVRSPFTVSHRRVKGA